MNSKLEILEKIKSLVAGIEIEEIKGPMSEEDFHDISDDLKSRMDVGVYLGDELKDDQEMADILEFVADVGWDGFKSSGVSVKLKGNEIVNHIIEIPYICLCKESGAMQIRDHAEAFRQIAGRLDQKAKELVESENPKTFEP